MQFDRGYLSPYFVTDPERMEVVLENPVILIHEKKISSMKDLLPVLELVARAGRPLLIIAEDIEGEALATHRRQQAAGTLQRGRGEGARLRRSPESDARRRRYSDQWPGGDRGPRIRLESITMDDLGQAKKVTIDKDNTTIIEGAGHVAAIEGRVKQLRAQVEDTTSDYDREKLQERLAKLVGRRGDHQGRRGDRDRDEGKEGARRGCDARDQGRGRRRHRAGRRCGTAAGVEGAPRR